MRRVLEVERLIVKKKQDAEHKTSRLSSGGLKSIIEIISGSYYSMGHNSVR